MTDTSDTPVIRVVIADRNMMFRAALRRVLEMERDVVVVGDGANVREALDLCDRLDPDVVLVDLDLPPFGGLSATESLLRRRPNQAVVMLSLVRPREQAASGVDLLLKDVPADEILSAIRRRRPIGLPG